MQLSYRAGFSSWTWLAARVQRPLRCLLVTAALGMVATAAQAQTISIAAAKTPLSLPLYVASQKGFFTEEGLDVTLNECNGGHSCLTMVLEGKADLGTCSELPIVFRAFERSDFVVLGTMANTNQDLKLLVHTRSGINKSKDLAGKRVGVVARSSSQYFFELYLLTNGLDPHDVTAVSLQPDEMQPALLAGRLDAAVVWEPHAYGILKALGNNARVMPPIKAYLLTFNLVAQRRLVGHRDKDLAGLLRAVDRAERFIRERPEEAKAILLTALKIEPEFVDTVWPSTSYRLGLDQSLINTMEGEARWARREGHVQGKNTPNFLGLLHTAPLKLTNPAAVGITP